MSKLVIAGAGLAGLLAASMLRGERPTLIEQQPSLPNNHSALLRFKTSVVGDATGIPFTPVQVMKAVFNPTNPCADAASYSLKTLGKATLRSISSAQGQIEKRFIAPPDFIPRLADQMKGEIIFGESISRWLGKGDLPLISTVPMPVLMDLLEYPGPRPAFKSLEGWAARLELDPELVDICTTLYYPGLEPQYRASITRSTLIVEGVGPVPNLKEVQEILIGCASDLGIGSIANFYSTELDSVEVKGMKYSKIAEVAPELRKRFILWASEQFGIYSLGRFATWRPGLLLDDLVQDIRLIQGMLNGDSSTSYELRK